MQTHCLLKNIVKIVMDRTAVYYSSPSYTFGASAMPIFSGSRRQRGGSIFGTIKGFLMPVLSSLGKKIAKRGAREAVGFAKDVASEAFTSNKLSANPVKRIAKKRALSLGRFATDEGLDANQKMIDSGRRSRRRKRRLQPRRKVGKRKNLRKRKASKRRRQSQPKKRRRVSKANF